MCVRAIGGLIQVVSDMGKPLKGSIEGRRAPGQLSESRMRWNLTTILAVETWSVDSIGNNRRTVRPVTSSSNLRLSPHPSYKCGRQCCNLVFATVLYSPSF
jgi:hypothetical protein